MRIVQIIDSLHVGGAERMAVNYANALVEKVAFSGLIATRKEGALLSQIRPEVGYLYLDKKMTVDVPAVLRLRSYCKKNQIDIIHAHGTSYFIAFLLKMIHPKIKVIWHEHKGARSSERLGQNQFLWLSSRFFSGIIVVDHTLEVWCKSVLQFKKVMYLPNFTLSESQENRLTVLKGQDHKRILCVANLRYPKNHNLLIAVAVQIKEKFPDWTFHLVGNDFDDAYSKTIKAAISHHSLEETVYLYGLRQDSAAIIDQAEIAVLTSISEGLPVALLEYGLHKKAVVATHVGEIPLIVKNGKNGFIVPSENEKLFSEALIKLIESPKLRHEFGEALYQTIMQGHSQQAVIGHYLEWINQI